MLTQKLTTKRKVKALLKLGLTTLQGRPRLMNLEVTKFCNAKCDFCDYWKTKKSPRLDDYVDVVRKVRPIVVNITGGEPLLRKDLPHLIRRIHENTFFIYIGMVTHGQLLTVEKARELWDSGLDQLSISMNYLGEAHDRERGIPGLFDHLSKLIPQLLMTGVDNVILNTVIMNENLNVIPRILRQAYEWGIKVSFSSYTALKNGNAEHLVSPEKMRKLRDLIDEIEVLKRAYGNVVSSSYYLNMVPYYFEHGYVEDCKAGQKFIQATPDGYLKACPELPVTQHFSDYKPWKEQVDCTKCWYGCRGESQVPVTIERFRELAMG